MRVLVAGARMVTQSTVVGDVQGAFGMGVRNNER
jgi:hypothetical protein